jgi:hypothetical protein
VWFIICRKSGAHLLHGLEGMLAFFLDLGCERVGSLEGSVGCTECGEVLVWWEYIGSGFHESSWYLCVVGGARCEGITSFPGLNAHFIYIYLFQLGNLLVAITSG